MSVTATALMYAHPYYGHHHGCWWIGGIIPLLFVALFVFWFVRFAVWRRRGCGPWRSSVDAGSPQRILAERYARGEIDESEYRERRAVLDGDLPRKSD